MPDQKQTVIVDVPASEVESGWELWRAAPKPMWHRVHCYRPALDSRSVIFNGREGKSWKVPEDEPVIVRRPVPSGADALREALAAAKTPPARRPADYDLGWNAALEWAIERVAAVPAVASSGAEGGDREQCDSCEGAPGRAVGDPAAPEFICDDCLIDMGLAEYHRARNAQHAPPLSPSAGAEGEREAERFRRAINLLRATADQRREIATNDLSRPADARSRAASAAREFADAADVLAAAPAPAVTDPEGVRTRLHFALAVLQSIERTWTTLPKGYCPVCKVAPEYHGIGHQNYCPLRRVLLDLPTPGLADLEARYGDAAFGVDGWGRRAHSTEIVNDPCPAPSKETSTDAE